MRIGIVILNYCDSDTTLKMLNQIKDYNVLDLIVVVDNDSKDDSYEKLKKEENEKIKVIKTDRNSGYASGNKPMVKHTKISISREIRITG